MPTQQPLPVKKDVTRALLLKGTVFLHLDPRDDSVVVPSWLKQQPQLVLQIGLEMPIPIPDLRVDDEGMFGTLSFNRQPFTCEVPWDRVFAVVGDDGRGMVWPDSMPKEIAAEVDREAERKAAPAGPARRRADDGEAGDEAGIRNSRHPMPLHTDDELPDGAFRVRSRPPEAAAQSDDDAEDGTTGKTRRPPHVTAIEGGGQNSTPPMARGGNSGRVKLPPYMRVVK